MVLAFAAAGCGGSGDSGSETDFELADAQTFADGFVRRLVVAGRWSAVQSDVAPLVAREVRPFHYRLRGDQVETDSGKRRVVRGLLQIWFRPDDGTWEMSSYSYDATVDGRR